MCTPVRVRFIFTVVGFHLFARARLQAVRQLRESGSNSQPRLGNRADAFTEKRGIQAVKKEPITDQASSAAGWMSNIVTPAALVGGAAIASFFELRESLSPAARDAQWVKLLKPLTTLLLLAAFSCEMMSIFVCTVTGTMLLGNADKKSNILNTFSKSPIGMLQRELELEYLTARIGFFQGILNWLTAIAIQLTLPGYTRDEFEEMSDAAKVAALSALRFHRASASAMGTLVLMIIAFYNKHLSFYGNYASMIGRFFDLTVQRYILCQPARVVPIIALVPASICVFYVIATVVAALRIGERSTSCTQELAGILPLFRKMRCTG